MNEMSLAAVSQATTAPAARSRIFTRSARSRPSVTCRRTCMPGPFGASGKVRPRRPCRSKWFRPGNSIRTRCSCLVMAAGVNYNGVWASLGTPVSMFDVHKQPYHIAGSDASGIVWAVGSKVKRWKVGDEVVIHCNQDDGDDEECNGGDPMFSPSQRIWGYETPDGSFAQFCRVQDRQLLERPKHLTWEEAACYTLVLATSYRMLFGHRPHTLKPGHNVLVWGASRRPRLDGGAALRHRRRQCDRRRLGRRQARIRDVARRQGRHQPQELRLLGPDAQSRYARIRCLERKRCASSARRSGRSRARASMSIASSSIRASRPFRCPASW